MAQKQSNVKVQYKDLPPPLHPKKQTIVDGELKKLYTREGHLSPDLVLTEATNPNNPLHAYFEWDDDVAAHKFRLSQAAALLQASKFVCLLLDNKKGGPQVVESGEVRVYLSTRKNGKFKKRDHFMADADMQAAFIERKLQELRSWCESVMDVLPLQKTRKAIEKLLP